MSARALSRVRSRSFTDGRTDERTERNVDEEQKTSRARDDSTSARRPRVVVVVVVVCGPVAVAIPPPEKVAKVAMRAVGRTRDMDGLGDRS